MIHLFHSGIYTREKKKAYIHLKFTQIFRADLYVAAKNQKQHMNEQFIVYPYYEILFGNKMEKKYDTCNDMDKSQNNYAA